MFRRALSKITILAICLLFNACASFEPGLRYQDLMRPRQPTAKQEQEGLEVSIEEFATAQKSLQAFDADIAPYGILPLLLKVNNGGSQSYRLREHEVNVFLGNESLASISGDKAASQSANSEYAGKALGWTVATGPFFILLWPATIAGSASHTAAVNRRIEQHFESMRFNDSLLRPNQSAAGFLYFKLPSGIKRLENLRVEVTPSEEQTAKRLSFSLSLPTLDMSSAVSSPASGTTRDNNP
jgi:hypothetical protein